ncbi:MAG: hypothetical protein J6B60_04010 [Clostridia bacterium]|nr:hypothetical protein [Clostridia bacterium]
MKKYEAPIYEMEKVETSDVITVSSWTTTETDPVTGKVTSVTVNVESVKNFL